MDDLEAYLATDGARDMKVQKPEHDPADVEYMARLLCIADGRDPDKKWNENALHNEFKFAAERALDHMAATGVKMTTRRLDALPIPDAIWEDYHDLAPMTPRDNAKS